MPRRRKAEEEEVYHVEVITKARVSEEGAWEYLVKWAGYGSDADSWEPAENVKQCDRLLASFWKHVGTDDNDYSVGYEIAAEGDWINKEKLYFKETFLKPSKRKSDKAAKKDSQEWRKSESSTPHISESTTDDDEGSDHEPFVKSSLTQRPNRKARVVDTESDSDSDGPSRKQARAPPRPKMTTAPLKEISKVPAKRQEILSAAGGSASIAPPKPAVRTHQDQRVNPLVKAMNIPSAGVEAGSSLSTKQRIAAGIPPPPTGPKPLLVASKKSLSALSFKKNRPAIGKAKETTTSAPVLTPTSPVVSTTEVTDDAVVVASPQPMDVDLHVDLWGSLSDDTGLPGGSGFDIPAAPIPPKSQDEINAEKFLQTVDIPLLSAPLEPGEMYDQPDQLTVQSVKAAAIPKIPKKWKWSGDLFISTSESKAELLCAVTIVDPSGSSTTTHINLLLSSLDSLRISRLHPVMELQPLLRGCAKPQYYGTLEPSESSEEAVVFGLEYHLTNEGLAAAIPLLLDATAVAVLLVFPGVQQGLSKFLQVPEPLSSGTHLLVVLLPFLVSATTSIQVTGQRPTDTVQQSSHNLQDVLVPLELPQEVMLHQAISLLSFPDALLGFLNSTSLRTYCIWPSPDQILPGLDTILLQCILKSSKAQPAKLEEDVRVVFISNQHVETLHTMPSLAIKLANSPETQFWTYGYAVSMPFQRWRVQEIYPLGGIVTFTSSALAEDLVGCYYLMSQIIEHPLWDCYLIPEVLAVTHLLCNDTGLGSSIESCLDPILDSINLGQISVVRMPGKDHLNQMAWLSHIFNQSNVNGQELLEVYHGILRSHPSTPGMRTEQLVSFTNNEVIKDLLNARIQPTFMESHRRFVVIRATTEDSVLFEKDGLECSTLSLFSFKDDYFPS